MLLLLALALLPLPTLAQTPITTCTELQNIRSNLGGNYYLANDIDCSGFGNFEPIGTSSSKFTGTFDGKGYKISGSEIKNEGLEAVDVS